MKKTIACTLSICAISAVLATGCVKKDINNSKTEIITSTTAVKEQTSTTLPEIVTTAVPKKEPNYDKERIKVIKWDMNRYGGRIPLKVIVEGVTYEYIYDENLLLQAIKGSDGTSIELSLCDDGIKVERNGIIVKYFPSERMAPGTIYDGFEYDGKEYTYQFGKGVYITGILDSDNNLVAEYKYIQGDKGDKIEVINYTEDKLGDINSMRYIGVYYDEITGFIRWGCEVYNMVNGEMETLKG